MIRSAQQYNHEQSGGVVFSRIALYADLDRAAHNRGRKPQLPRTR